VGETRCGWCAHPSLRSHGSHTHTLLNDADLNVAELHDAELDDAELDDADLDDAELDDADLHDADLNGAQHVAPVRCGAVGSREAEVATRERLER